MLETNIEFWPIKVDDFYVVHLLLFPMRWAKKKNSGIKSKQKGY